MRHGQPSWLIRWYLILIVMRRMFPFFSPSGKNCWKHSVTDFFTIGIDMIRMLIALFFGCFFSAPGFSNPGRNLEVRSPDGELALAVEFDSAISFLLIHEQDT